MFFWNRQVGEEAQIARKARNCGDCKICLLLSDPGQLDSLIAGERMCFPAVEQEEEAMLQKRGTLCELYATLMAQLRKAPVRKEIEWAGGSSDQDQLLTPIVNKSTLKPNQAFYHGENGIYRGPTFGCLVIQRLSTEDKGAPLQRLETKLRHPDYTMHLADPRVRSPLEVRFSDGLLEVFTQNDHSQELLGLTPPNAYLASHGSFNKARAWLQGCLSSPDHSSCHKQCLSSELPKRLLDVSVSKKTVRLVECSDLGQDVQFASLSYCSGQIRRALTTKKSLGRNLSGISTAKLPHSLQDAILVTKELGLSYLWIDALCLCHDDDDEMAVEKSRMHSAYASSTVTIVAANSRSCQEGFLKPRKNTVRYLENSFPIPIHTGAGKHKAFVSATAHVNVDEEPVSQRAWPLQECWMSRRLLIYSSNQLQWLCLSSCSTDGGLHTWAPSFERRRTILRNENTSEEIMGTLMLEWEDLVMQYTSRSMSESRDKLPAIAGLAATFHKLVMPFDSNVQYLAGIWSTNIPKLLMWHQIPSRSASPCRRLRAYRHSESGKHYLNPSWTWASVSGTVYPSSSLIDDSRRTSDIQILDVEVIYSKAMYGELHSGTLRLRGKCVSMTAGQVRERFAIHSNHFSPQSHSTVDTIYPDAGKDNEDFSGPDLAGIVRRSRIIDLGPYQENSTALQGRPTKVEYTFLQIWTASETLGPCGLVLQHLHGNRSRRTGVFVLPLKDFTCRSDGVKIKRRWNFYVEAEERDIVLI